MARVTVVPFDGAGGGSRGEIRERGRGGNMVATVVVVVLVITEIIITKESDMCVAVFTKDCS